MRIFAACMTMGLSAGACADELWAIRGGELFTIDTESLTAELVGFTGFTNIGGLAFDADGKLYGMDSQSNQLISIDVSDASATVIGGGGYDPSFSMGMGFDPTTDTLYASAAGAGTSSQFLSIDSQTGMGTLISDTPAATIVGLDADASGQIWAVDGASSREELIKIDKVTGAVEVIAPQSLADFGDIGGFDIGPSGTFWAINSSNYELLSIDPETGVGTSLGLISGIPTGGFVTGIASIPTPATALLLLPLVLHRRRRAT